MAIDKCYMLQLGKIDFQLLCSNLERLILNYSIAGNAAKKISSASTALPKKRLLIKTNHSTMTASRKASMAYDSSSNEDDDEIVMMIKELIVGISKTMASSKIPVEFEFAPPIQSTATFAIHEMSVLQPKKPKPPSKPSLTKTMPILLMKLNILFSAQPWHSKSPLVLFVNKCEVFIRCISRSIECQGRFIHILFLNILSANLVFLHMGK
ncbi:unnamed protein product [Prunus armeniaca]